MNLRKELQQISKQSSVGWDHRFEEHMINVCQEAAKAGDTFIIIHETERFDGKKIGKENLFLFAAKYQLEAVEYDLFGNAVKIFW